MDTMEIFYLLLFVGWMIYVCSTHRKGRAKKKYGEKAPDSTSNQKVSGG